MRNKMFITVQRGGALTPENHRKIIKWARECSEHVLPLIKGEIDNRLVIALQVAKEWELSNVRTGEAMKASARAHSAARDYSDPVSVAVARSAGHAVATAHMADHSMGAALYGLVAVVYAKKSVSAEMDWQTRKLLELPLEIAELIKSSMIKKTRSFKVLSQEDYLFC